MNQLLQITYACVKSAFRNEIFQEKSGSYNFDAIFSSRAVMYSFRVLS